VPRAFVSIAGIAEYRWALAILAACSSYSPGNATGEIDAACYPNATCNAGLTCRDARCIITPASAGCIANGMKDPAEEGIDCGGACSAACIKDAGVVDAPVVSEASRPLRSCVDLPTGATTGVYRLEPAGRTPFETVCNTSMPGGPWALVYRSKGQEMSAPTEFWKILYPARFQTKGLPRDALFYEPNVYYLGKTYRDMVVDVNGTEALAFEATTDGIDPSTMRFMAPRFHAGNEATYASQFASGWSSLDHDDDTYTLNCAKEFSGVTQHYSTCWNYNLGADETNTDTAWGPHVNRSILTAIGLTAPAGPAYPRVREITRWAKW
jgi:hypothetical protein